jgi:hypothetical protein
MHINCRGYVTPNDVYRIIMGDVEGLDHGILLRYLPNKIISQCGRFSAELKRGTEQLKMLYR